MSPELLTLLMFGTFFVSMAIGIPVAFSLGALGAVFGLILFGIDSFAPLSYLRVWSTTGAYSFIAIPLFVFMANMLRYSGIAENLFKALHIWMGPVRGGLAIAAIIACTILAAMVGTAGAGETIMGLIALPAMLQRYYSKHMALGSILSGGTLGILIPPSIMFIIYGVFAQQSIGKLFVGGIIPGLILAGLYAAYVAIRCWVNPKLGPALPKEERAKITLREKLILTRSLILPGLLILGVIGSIFTGIATPGEAAGVGSLGAIICTAISRKLSWQNLKESVYATIKTVGMIMLVVFGAVVFVGTYQLAGGTEFVKGMLLGLELGPWGTLLIMQCILILLGMVLDVNGIVILTVPIFIPVIKELGFDPLWFGVIFNINLQIAFISPPFGYSLFYLKGVAPPEVSMLDTYRAALPFIVLQIIGLAICMIFPQTVLWLPGLMIK